MTDIDLSPVKLPDPRLAQPDLDDAGMAALLNIPVDRVKQLADADVYKYVMRGVGPRKLRRYTPRDVEYNREVAERVEPTVEATAPLPSGISGVAPVPPQRLAKGAARLRASGSRARSSA